METQKANGVSPKENGSQRPPSYSVETPYGFHLDLDFLKYVEDIEKGNTIRRVPIQRRPRRRSSGNLSRNLSLPGHGCRSAQWSATLFPKSRLADSPQSYEFQSSSGRPSGFSGGGFASQMEATIKAFDEQPLGHHVRPNLLRASSLPITTLLRKYSESTEDPTSPNGSRDYLAQENGSSEDVFHGPEKKARGVNGTFQQLSAALRRVGQLEEEIRIIPELKAQICILQEERERLLHALQSQDSKNPEAPTQDPNDDWMNREYDRLEKNVKASSEQVHALEDLPGLNLDLHSATMFTENEGPSDRSRSLVKTLQSKMTTLEQKLSEVELDLEKTRQLLKEQLQQSSLKDDRIKELTQNLGPDIWVQSERTTDGASDKSDPEPSTENASCLDGEFKADASHEAAGTNPDAELHVKKVKELLNEQWACLCRDEDSENVPSSKHLPPRARSIQEELITLVDLLSLYVSSAGAAPPSAQESMMKEQESAVSESTWESPAQDDEIEGLSGEDRYLMQSDAWSKQLAEELIQKFFQTEAEETPVTGLTCGERDSGLEQIAEAELQEDGEGARGREPNVDFMRACYFLEDHMDEVSEPNDEMSQALTVAFQQWFHVAAEEDSCSDTVSLYLSEVSTKTPTVLPFLVNMVDDNGNTALHYSVSHANFSIVKPLLDTGVCEVDLKNKIGYTAIMLASLLPVDAAADLNVIEQLLELGDVNARAGQVGQTALHLAVRHGRASVVRLLLAHGANVNAQDQAGTTALISACDRGHADIVQILLENPDCDVNLTDKGGRSALSLATQASHTEIADLLKARTSSKGHDKCKVS